MSIQTELARLTNAKAAIKAAIEGKGVTVPSGTLLDGMASLIEAIEAGGVENVEISNGKIIPSEDIICTKTSPYSILHGLSGQPDMFVIFLVASSANVRYMLKTAQYISSKFGGFRASAGCTYQNGTTIYSDHYMFSTNTSSYVSVGQEDVEIAVNANDDIKLVSGKTYHWFAVRWK